MSTNIIINERPLIDSNTADYQRAYELHTAEDWKVWSADQLGAVQTVNVPPDAITRTIWLGLISGSGVIKGRMEFLRHGNVVGNIPYYRDGALAATATSGVVPYFPYEQNTPTTTPAIRLYYWTGSASSNAYANSFQVNVSCDAMRIVSDITRSGGDVLTGFRVISQYPVALNHSFTPRL